MGSSSSGELECSAPNTPSYPRPEATFDWSFQADRYMQQAPFHDRTMPSIKFISCSVDVGSAQRLQAGGVLP